MCRVFTVFFIAALLLAPSRAAAQSVAEANTVTVTPFVSVTFGTSQDLAQALALGSDLGTSLGIGGAIGYDWTPNIGVEFELGRVFDIAGDNDALDIKLTTISGNFIYHFDVVRVTPYATAGLGWERVSIDLDDPELDDPDGETEIAWNFGGGLKVPINSRILGRVDLRRFQGNDFAPDHWRLYGGVTFWIKR